MISGRKSERERDKKLSQKILFRIRMKISWSVRKSQWKLKLHHIEEEVINRRRLQQGVCACVCFFVMSSLAVDASKKSCNLLTKKKKGPSETFISRLQEDKHPYINAASLNLTVLFLRDLVTPFITWINASIIILIVVMDHEIRYRCCLGSCELRQQNRTESKKWKRQLEAAEIDII